jgi:hypothetical protein
VIHVSRRLCIAGLLALLALSALVVIRLGGCESWSPSSIEESKKRAEPIIAALEAYYTAHGQFPKTLQDLVPEHIDELPQPAAGTGQWHYASREGSFSLSFGCGKHHYPNCTFSWKSRNWLLDH